MFKRSYPAEKIEIEENELDKRAKLLEQYGAVVEKDEFVADAYIIKFLFDEAVTTIRILLKDNSGADLIITNMTTLPTYKTKFRDIETSKGFGSSAIQSVLAWAAANNLKNIRAVQVQNEKAENFWMQNGFAKCEEPNQTNDFIYQEPEKQK